MGAWWDEDHKLWLITLEEFERLPDGFELTCIFGKKYIKGKDEIDMDVRFGHLAYGSSKKNIQQALGEKNENGET